jgi:hypothetical protein
MPENDTTTTITHPDGTVVTVTTLGSNSNPSEAEPPIVKDERPRVLATGGAGFIGSHTVVELLSAGIAVLCARPPPSAVQPCRCACSAAASFVRFRAVLA